MPVVGHWRPRLSMEKETSHRSKPTSKEMFSKTIKSSKGSVPNPVSTSRPVETNSALNFWRPYEGLHTNPPLLPQTNSSNYAFLLKTKLKATTRSGLVGDNTQRDNNKQWLQRDNPVPKRTSVHYFNATSTIILPKTPQWISALNVVEVLKTNQFIQRWRRSIVGICHRRPPFHK